jgi:hypothetical protein
VFVPPWNAYDAATVEALTREGFACLSANRYGPYQPGALQFAPITVEITGLRAAVAAVRQHQDPDPVIGVLMHHYDFKESGDSRGVITCKELDAELEWLMQQPDVRVASISSLAGAGGALSADRYRANQPLSSEPVLPPWVPTTSETPFFLSEKGARRANTIRALSIFVTYLGAALLGLMAARLFAAGGATPLGELLKYLAGAILLGVLLRAVVQRELHFRPMLVVSVLFGILLSW